MRLPIQSACYCYLKSSFKFVVLAAFIWLVGGVSLAWAQQNSKLFWDAANQRGFQFDVLDMYQHQNRGAAHDADWEKDGGWCQPNAYMDALYGWKVSGYDTMNAAITVNNTWLASGTATLKSMAADWFTATPAGPLDRWLKSRPGGKVGLDGGVQGLMEVRVLGNKGGKLTYSSWGLNSDNTQRKLPGKAQDLTVYQAATDSFSKNRSVVYIILNEFMSAQAKAEGLWWAEKSYHTVTMAGVDVTRNRLWFADPDSNKGNAGSDAGITGGFPGPAMDPIIEAKRFQPSDPIPVAARIPGQPSATPTGVAAYYREVTMDGDGYNFANNIAENERYRFPYIFDYRTIERVKSAKAALPPPIAPATEAAVIPAAITPYPQTFHITAGMVENVDSFWLFPNSEFDPLSLSFTAFGGMWSLTDVVDSTEQVFGNDFPYGGFQFTLNPGGQPLLAYDKEFTGAPPSLSYGTLTFNTATDVTAWDTYFRDASDPTGQTWDVQSFGAFLPTSPPQLVPEPMTLANAFTASVLLLRLSARRRRDAVQSHPQRGAPVGSAGEPASVG
jgi:hypothetical protein